MSRAEELAERRAAERASTSLKALRLIHEAVTRDGYPPSRREIAEHLGYQSQTDAQKAVQRLVDAGLVEVKAGSPRAISITSAGMIALTEVV